VSSFTRADTSSGARTTSSGARTTSSGARPKASRRRSGPITPVRAMFVVALVGSAAFIAWGVTQRGATQVPLLVSGLGILGLTLGALALAGAVAAYRAGVTGRGARAFWTAFLGGIVAIVACGCLSGAVLLTLLWRVA
jgi:hypothetical protein